MATSQMSETAEFTDGIGLANEEIEDALKELWQSNKAFTLDRAALKAAIEQE